MCIQAHVIISKLATAPIYGSTQPRFTLFSHQGEAPVADRSAPLWVASPLCTRHSAGTLAPYMDVIVGSKVPFRAPFLLTHFTLLCL